MIALLGVALLGVLPGILIAVTLSILNVFRRPSGGRTRPSSAAWRASAGLHDTATYPEAELLPGLVVYRFDAPLIFANGRIFGDEIRAIVEERPGLKWIVIAAEPVTDVDTTRPRTCCRSWTPG